MTKKSILCVTLALFFVHHAIADAPRGQIMPVATTSEINSIIDRQAWVNGVSAARMHQLIRCESSKNQNAVGDEGRSFGLVQIFLPAHPEISQEEALNPEFAIRYLAREMKKGNISQWTCGR